MARQQLRSVFSRRLALESLEPKQMLAGDVTVSQVGGNLLIEGDDLANQLVVTAGETAGSYVIRGLEGTTVTLAGSSTPAPETGLVVTGVRGFVNVTTGDGSDDVTVENAKFRVGLTIATGDGDDEVLVQDVQVGGALNILLGDGADRAQVDRSSAIGALIVGGGLGADEIAVSDVRSATLILRGGDGDAADEIDIARAKAFAAVIGTGDGADRVGIVDSAFTSLNVALGGGDDELSLQKTKARIAVLSGGEGGSDEYLDAGENALKHRIVTGFELPEGVNAPARNAFPRLSNLLTSVVGRLFR